MGAGNDVQGEAPDYNDLGGLHSDAICTTSAQLLDNSCTLV
jgi:hypothetical protein